MKIYTKVGDHGFTKQMTGKMVPKYDYQIAAVGELDELESYLGVVIANLSTTCVVLHEPLQKLQRTLYSLASELVIPEQQLTAEAVNKLEQQIDHYSALLPPLTAFILPGGTVTAANLQYARTLARRAERTVIELDAKEQKVAPICLQYLNRLSDYLFILGRYANFLDGSQDIPSQANTFN